MILLSTGKYLIFFFYTVTLLTFTCSFTVGALNQCSRVLTSVSSMAWEDSNAHCYLARGHLGSVKGAGPLCWTQLWETRKWAIKRESDGKNKSFADCVMGNGSLNTIQTEKGVLSTTAFWVFAINNYYVPTSRPWGCACLIYWYRYGLWEQLEICETSSVDLDHYLPLKLHIGCLSTFAGLDLSHLSFRLSVCLWKYWIGNLLWPKHWY